MRARALLALPLIFVAAAIAPRASAADAGVAALQVGLHSHGLYQGPIDGLSGPGTARAIRRLQKRAHITVDGIVGRHIDAALRRFQTWASLKDDGVVGPATVAALAAPPPAIPLPLTWPMTAPVLGDRFGPRGDRWHSGIDLPAPMGAPVYAARSGRVVWAGWREGGWGFLVVVAHGHGERSMYAHLSRIDVRVGVWIGEGVRVGLVGATGDATGPHLHFEVRVRGAAIDPLRALPAG